jgi:hypothetical protein
MCSLSFADHRGKGYDMIIARALVAALAVVTVLLPVLVAARTPYVLNLDHYTFWKVVRPGRVAVVKFDVEHPHGQRQDEWVRFAEDLALSTPAVEVLVGECRIKDGDDGGKSENIPLWEYFNVSIYTPPHLVAIIPIERINAAATVPATAQSQEFDLSNITELAHRPTHRALLFSMDVTEQFTSHVGARWVNAILRRYPAVDAKTKAILPRGGGAAKDSLGWVSFRGIAPAMCARLSRGAGEWAALAQEAAREDEEAAAAAAKKKRAANDAKAERADAQSEGGAAAEADDRAAAAERVRERLEMERVATTADGRRARDEAKKQAEDRRHRGWTAELLAKLAARAGGAPASTAAAADREFVELEQRKLRLLAQAEGKLSDEARQRADFQLSMLWCARSADAN